MNNTDNHDNNNNDQNSLILPSDLETYNEKMNYYLRHVPDKNLLVEVTKCCGYSEILPISKSASLVDLYNTVETIFQCHRVCELYIKIKNPELNNMCCSCEDSKMIYHITKNTTERSLKELLVQYNIRPIYPLPANTVYRIYLDDGHRHDTHKCMFDNIV